MALKVKKQVNVNLFPDEIEAIREVAEKQGRSLTSLLAALIRVGWEECNDIDNLLEGNKILKNDILNMGQLVKK